MNPWTLQVYVDALISCRILLGVTVILILVTEVARKIFAAPPGLRHLPRVHILPLIWSYLSGENENKRIKRLLLPFAEQHGEGLVVVWALGRWMVHILDPKIFRYVLDNPDIFPKEPPPDDLILWKFIGNSNILLQNGEGWRRHSRIVRTSLNQSPPIEQFATLARKLCAKIGVGGTVRWDDLSQQFTLDAVGTTVLGHDFDALGEDNAFVREYNGVMRDIANPLYLVMPSLERWIPRKTVLKRMNALVTRFENLLREKKKYPGDDVMTSMLKEPDMSDAELRDDMVVLFIAGHDTSAGALSTLMYYLAIHRDKQAKARAEIHLALEETDDMDLKSVQNMPYLQACVKEALRINTPISYIVPRISAQPVKLGPYHIPPDTSLICNIYAAHHTERYWANSHCFQPERFQAGTQSFEDVWVPFAFGPRQCPARNFALYELRTVAAVMLLNYEWNLSVQSIHADGIQNAFSPFALSVPHDLYIDFKKRVIIP